MTYYTYFILFHSLTMSSNCRNIQGCLYKYRWQFIPKDPKDPHSTEFSFEHPFFELKDGENIVKNESFLDGKRILVNATDKTLELMSKALSLHIDGTFAITPRKWYQTLIITAEVATGVWGKCEVCDKLSNEM